MIRPILKYGDDTLHSPARPVESITSDIDRLIDDMIETMYAAPGVGLAAPQVGVPLRICVIDLSVGRDPNGLIVLINPEIVKTEGSQKSEEGCLSLPTFREQVVRPLKVTVVARDAKGKQIEMAGDDLLARAFLHETDHLNGKLYISHISALKRDLIRRKVRKLQKAGEWE